MSMQEKFKFDMEVAPNKRIKIYHMLKKKDYLHYITKCESEKKNFDELYLLNEKIFFNSVLIFWYLKGISSGVVYQI